MLVFKKHSGPTPADDIAPKSSQTVETSHWTSSNLGYELLHPSSRLWDLGFQMKYKTCSHLKRGLWTTGQQSSSSSLSPGKTPLTTTVAKFLDTSVCGALDALTPASVHSLWSSPKFLNRFCLTILIRLRFSRLVVHLFLPLNFLLTCLDTALCEQLLW